MCLRVSLFWSGTSSTAPNMAFTSQWAQGKARSDSGGLHPERGNEGVSSHRRRALHVLFVHRNADSIDCCVQELEKAQFTVKSDFVLNLGQCSEQLRDHAYDVVVIEYPSKSCNASQAFPESLLRIPVVFLTSPNGVESLAGLSSPDAFEYIEQAHLAHLPMAVRRALNAQKLRTELEEAESALRHSRSLYRALADNPSYGICRCDAEGKFIDVNQTLVLMLGYESKSELLAASSALEIALDVDPGQKTPFGGSSAEPRLIQPVEIEWKRKNGTSLRARISGRNAFDEQGNFNGCEIIAVDVSDQRTLEDQLRLQASSDSLTGLANYRQLFEVLHSEISRSKRTGREFSLLLLDLDGLKHINDQLGHLAGNRALCRLARIMADCCRSIDTAARHGGDEFAVVLPETGLVAAMLVADRICDLLAKDAEAPPLSVSVGVANYPREADTIGALLHAADKALYAMKGIQPNSSIHPKFSNASSTDRSEGGIASEREANPTAEQAKAHE